MTDRGLRRLVEALADQAARRPPVPLAWFFPDPRAGPGPLLEAAQNVCSSCPVLGECRAYGDLVERGRPKTDLHGVLGGEGPLERHQRRAAGAASAA